VSFLGLLAVLFVMYIQLVASLLLLLLRVNRFIKRLTLFFHLQLQILEP
jgi:hypothetical protein